LRFLGFIFSIDSCLRLFPIDFKLFYVLNHYVKSADSSFFDSFHGRASARRAQAVIVGPLPEP
jgi:uncharacterized membrane protein required for colicin V production